MATTDRNPQQAASFLKADDNTLLLLDRDGNPLVGDFIFSNTLTRADDPVSTCFARPIATSRIQMLKCESCQAMRRPSGD